MIEGPRACRPEEFDETLALINATFRPDSDQDILTDYPLIFNDGGLRYMRILKAAGQVVAHVPVAPRRSSPATTPSPPASSAPPSPIPTTAGKATPPAACATACAS